MSSYLFPYQSVTYQPYEGPIQLYGQALAYKNAKFAEGLANIRSHYDNVLNAPLTNESDQLAVRKGIDDAMARLSKTAVGDVSLPENQAEINSVFDNILNDPDIMYDMAWTRRHQKEIRKAEDLQKKNPELVPPQNLEPLYLAQEQFRSAPKGGRPRPVSFTPYYDFDSKMTEALDKVKPEVDVLFNQKGVQVEGPDGKMHEVTIGGQYTVEQLKDYTINKLVSQRLSSDAQALNQMQLDYSYNTRNGLYPPTNALQGIDQELATYKSADGYIQTALDSGLNLQGKALTDNERTILREQKKSIEAGSQRLNDLRNRIKIDPSVSNEYFTFDKHIKEYVGSKISQYAYSKQSLLSAIPGVNELNQYRYDVWKQQYKEQADAKSAAAAKTAEIISVPVPVNKILTDLDADPAGTHVDKADFQAIGDMRQDKDGKLYKDWTGFGAGPTETIIVTPASGNLDKAQIQSINSGTAFNKMKKELESLGIREDKPHWSGSAGTGGGGGSMVVGPVDLTGDEIIDNYRQHPDGNPKVKAVIDKYSRALGFDIKDNLAYDKLKKDLSDPTIKNAVDYGTTMKLNGRLEFVPSNDKNLMTGDDGRIYMKGHFVVPASRAEEALGSKGLRDGLRNSYVLDWGVGQTIGENDEKVGKRSEKLYAISAYFPTTSDLTAINDRLLDTKNYQSQWGSKAPEMRERSRQEVLNFQDRLNVARQLPSGEGVIYRDPLGGFRLTSEAYTEQYRRDKGDIVSLANDISTRTGIPYSDVISGVTNILGTAKTPYQRAQGLRNFELTVGSAAPDLNTRAARNNNPLNIKDNAVGGVSSTGKDNEGHAIFGTIGEGLQAGFNKINNIYTGQSTTYSANDTIEQFAGKYAESPTDANNLVSSIKSLGYNVTPNTKLSQVPVKILYEAIIMKEDRKYYNYLKNNQILDSFLNKL